MKRRRHNKEFFWGSGVALLFFCLAIFILPFILRKSYSADEPADAAVLPAATTNATVFVVTHVPTPEPMRALYMTACVAGTSTWRESLKDFVKNTELNSIVIDIKDYSGTISIYDPELQANDASGCKVRDMRDFVDRLHKENIYVIGRITVFQDPYYTARHPELAVKSKSTGGVWHDRKGLAFIDVGAKPYWDYIVSLVKASYNLGFDEINFDYIRYPSDGDMKDAQYTWTIASSTKSQMLEGFFSYLHANLFGSGMKTSADLFGLVTLAQDDMGIGQVLEKALPYFDYIYPMVYPSHFAYNTGGFGDPATHPYEIVKYSMTSGVAREYMFNMKMGFATSTPSKLRPWIQDFDLGAQYDSPQVRAQIQAAYDSGLTSWLSWDASNRYTKEAYLPAQAGLTQP
ncbi:putative glycoside hydrolase [Candidatus Parcubacteria bacterium]|nr:putative glycoside hydrolase [Candidatus Parcubacteria bacterium]